MLSSKWEERKKRYDFVIVGSGYGGSIMAARLSGAGLGKSVCLLERGKEWPVGSFPETRRGVRSEIRRWLNRLGLYEYRTFKNISVIQGNGLGGTSLINANVAIVPDAAVFRRPEWPRALHLKELLPYYERARTMLAARPHPHGEQLLKVKALRRRAREIDHEVVPLDIAVNFDIDGTPNAHGVVQHRCTDIGNCVTGCNVGAKNTLYMNYLPVAKANGADIFTRTEVRYIQKLPGGGYRLHGRHYGSRLCWRRFTLEADNVILAAGALGTSEILLRSQRKGLRLSKQVGKRFGGNGDFFAAGYNGDHQTNVLGVPSRAGEEWRLQGNASGPTIVAGIRYQNRELERQILIEDLSVPSAYVRKTGRVLRMLTAGGWSFPRDLSEVIPWLLWLLRLGRENFDTDSGDYEAESVRRKADMKGSLYRAHSALNHSMGYLVMGHEDGQGELTLRHTYFGLDGRLKIRWQGVGRQILFQRINCELFEHAHANGAYFVRNPLWGFTWRRKVTTAHPLGGCPMGNDHEQGAADEYGRVFTSDGGVHQGLYVADGSMIPTPLGANPFLTISALAERNAEYLIRYLHFGQYPQSPQDTKRSR